MFILNEVVRGNFEEYRHDLPPQNPHNVSLAIKRGWKFCQESNQYYDSDGYPVADNNGYPIYFD